MFAKCLKNTAERDDHAPTSLSPLARSCSSPTANSQNRSLEGQGLSLVGVPPLPSLVSHAYPSICLSISRPCQGHSCLRCPLPSSPLFSSRPDPTQRGEILIGPNRRKNEFPLERGEAQAASAFGRPRARYHSLVYAPHFHRYSDIRIAQPL